MSEFSPSEVPDATATVDDKERLKVKRLRRHIVEWVALLVLALVVTLTLRTFVFQTFYIPSGSMEPTLQIGDRIIVDKLAVDWGTIHRGDVMVFAAPPNENCSGVHDVDLVKRVIGLPGDTLYSVGNTIYVNGQKLNEAWTHTEPLGPPAIAPPSHPVVVAAGHYYMMGDNHSESCDSRYWGTITRSDIIGKAVLRVWPLRRIGFV
jgi:signal peptidase I